VKKVFIAPKFACQLRQLPDDIATEGTLIVHRTEDTLFVRKFSIHGAVF
jgi:hypothetical protein